MIKKIVANETKLNLLKRENNAALRDLRELADGVEILNLTRFFNNVPDTYSYTINDPAVYEKIEKKIACKHLMCKLLLTNFNHINSPNRRDQNDEWDLL